MPPSTPSFIIWQLLLQPEGELPIPIGAAYRDKKAAQAAARRRIKQFRQECERARLHSKGYKIILGAVTLFD